VINSAPGQAKAIEFKKIASNEHIQVTSKQAITIATKNLLPVRVLSQKNPGVAFKIAKEL